MHTQDIEKILQLHNVKPTANRILVYKTILNCNRTITMAEIEEQNPSLDKSSISRVLTLFKENHLVHTIDSGQGIAKYEICNSDCNGNHEDEHIHFHCKKCGQLICLENIKTKQPLLPEGFVTESICYVVHGYCPKCSKA